MGRKKDPIWFHFNPIHKSSGYTWAQCKYCGMQSSGIVERLRAHHDSCEGKQDDVVDDGYMEEEENVEELEGHNWTGSISSTSSPILSNFKCLVCGSTAEESTPQDYNLSLWDENCSKSFCKLFNLEWRWRGMLVKASYCHNCHNLFRDIDFSVRTLQLLEDKLQQSRSTLESLITENYETVKEAEREGGYDGLDEEYTGLVKMFYRNVLPNSSEYEDQDFKISPKGSYTRQSDPLAHDQEPEFNPPSTPCSNSRSGQGSEYEDELGQGEGGDPVDESDEPESESPRVEVIIRQGQDGEDESNLSDPEVNTDDFSTPEDSSDEDWEMETTKKKGKGNKGKIPTQSPPKMVKVIKVLTPKSTPRIIKVFTPKSKPKPPVIIVRPAPVVRVRDPSVDGTPERRVIWVARGEPKNSIGSTGHPPPPKNVNFGLIKCTEEGCTFTCSVSYKLDAHVNKVHKGDPQPFHCRTCPAKFGSITPYYLHQKRCRDNVEVTKKERKNSAKSEEPAPCTICQKTFISRRQLRKHVAVRHPLGDLSSCSSCSKMFEKQEELEIHEGLHKGRIDTMPFSCVLCDSGFTNSLDLKTHVRQEHEPLLQANKCGNCSKVFLNENRLKRHIQTVHTERSEEFKCPEPECKFLGLSKRDLGKHAGRHVTSRDFVCEICGQGYKAKSGLNYHMRAAHTKTKSYTCTLCDKKFSSGSLLKAHEESHNTVKTYICETCGKAFMAKKNLEQHNKSHLGIKIRYGKRFKNKGNNVEEKPKPRRRRLPPPSLSPKSEEDEEMEDEVSEGSNSPSSVYERHEPNPPNVQERLPHSSAGFQQLAAPVVPPPHFLMGSWGERAQGQPLGAGHQFQSQGPITDPTYPYSTIDLSHTSQLLSVLHQQQQQRRGTSSGQAHLQNYFNPRGQH